MWGERPGLFVNLEEEGGLSAWAKGSRSVRTVVEVTVDAPLTLRNHTAISTAEVPSRRFGRIEHVRAVGIFVSLAKAGSGHTLSTEPQWGLHRGETSDNHPRVEPSHDVFFCPRSNAHQLNSVFAPVLYCPARSRKRSSS